MADLPFSRNMFGQAPSGLFAPQSVLTEMLADRSVTTVKLAAGAVTNNELSGGVLGSKLADNSVPVQKIEQIAWTTYNPTLTATTTNPTLGTSSTSSGKYYKVGRMASGAFTIWFGGAGMAAGSGFYRVALPYPPALPAVDHWIIGHGYIYDSSAGTFMATILAVKPDGSLDIFPYNSPTTIGAASPWVWASSDRIEAQFSYESTT